jgi:hypothetical protein
VIALGVVGLVVVLVFVDPLKGRLWVAALLLGLLMAAVGLVTG